MYINAVMTIDQKELNKLITLLQLFFKEMQHFFKFSFLFKATFNYLSNKMLPHVTNEIQFKSIL